MGDDIEQMKERLKSGDGLAEELKEKIEALNSIRDKIIDSNIQLLNEIDEMERRNK